MPSDIRWKQRFDSYLHALLHLDAAVFLSGERSLSELEQQGLVHSFEFTHELAWKLMKDFLEEKGNTELYGSKDAVRESFNFGIIKNGEIWMDMIVKRNLSSYTYNKATSDEITEFILTKYINEFHALQSFLEDK